MRALTSVQRCMGKVRRGKGCDSSPIQAVGLRKGYSAKVEPYATKKGLEGADEEVDSRPLYVSPVSLRVRLLQCDSPPRVRPPTRRRAHARCFPLACPPRPSPPCR